MSYFIFLKNLDNIGGTIYKIAENQSDLNNLNINQPDYKIIEDSQSNFDLVKYGQKFVEKYNNNLITYINQTFLYKNGDELQNYINNFLSLPTTPIDYQNIQFLSDMNTPVGTGPASGIKSPSPEIKVTIPTSRPGTSVMALRVPGWPSNLMPKSRARIFNP